MLKEEEICSKHGARKTTAKIYGNYKEGITIINPRADKKKTKTFLVEEK